MLKAYALLIKEDKLELRSIDAKKLAKAFLAGAKSLQHNEDKINELNVFPVPDGDTGTNMTMTAISAAKAILDLDSYDFKSLGKAMSQGSLRGARGNSGVILSQLLRGFSKVIKKEESLNVKIIALALENATLTAYKAVMKPTEGTILTVARCMSEKAQKVKDSTDDIIEFLSLVVEEGDKALQNTPELLPVLKQAGVVDSGGAGLMSLLKGSLSYLKGEDVDLSFGDDSKDIKKEKKYSYKLSFILTFEEGTNYKRVLTFKTYLFSVGNNLTITENNNYMEASIDTDFPGDIIKKACILGAIHKITLTNLIDEENGFSLKKYIEEPNDSEIESESEKKEVGFVSVSCGDGINQIFLDLGVDQNIKGGQTMNPSTDDILKAVEKVSSDTVFVLPNNKNIILAANQAVSLEKNKKIIVIPTKTIPQGIAALINYDFEKTVDENKEIMSEEILNVKTGQVTYAVRDTEIDDKTIKSGDFMGISDKGIVSVGKDITKVLIEMIDTMVDDSSSLITLYYGDNVTEKESMDIKDSLTSKYNHIEVEVENGGQPVYSYVVSVE